MIIQPDTRSHCTTGSEIIRMTEIKYEHLYDVYNQVRLLWFLRENVQDLWECVGL